MELCVLLRALLLLSDERSEARGLSGDGEKRGRTCRPGTSLLDSADLRSPRRSSTGELLLNCASPPVLCLSSVPEPETDLADMDAPRDD